MKPVLKKLIVGALPVFASAAVAAGVESGPATQPSTQPVVQAADGKIASNDAPLIIPDGTSGPVSTPNDMIGAPTLGLRG